MGYLNAPDALRRTAKAEVAVAAVATANADATYGQPEADLINELKTKLNATLVQLRAHGILAP